MILLVVLFTVDVVVVVVVVVVVALVLPPTYFIRFFFKNVDPIFLECQMWFKTRFDFAEGRLKKTRNILLKKGKTPFQLRVCGSQQVEWGRTAVVR